MRPHRHRVSLTSQRGSVALRAMVGLGFVAGSLLSVLLLVVALTGLGLGAPDLEFRAVANGQMLLPLATPGDGSGDTDNAVYFGTPGAVRVEVPRSSTRAVELLAALDAAPACNADAAVRARPGEAVALLPVEAAPPMATERVLHVSVVSGGSCSDPVTRRLLVPPAMPATEVIVHNARFDASEWASEDATWSVEGIRAVEGLTWVEAPNFSIRASFAQPTPAAVGGCVMRAADDDEALAAACEDVQLAAGVTELVIPGVVDATVESPYYVRLFHAGGGELMLRLDALAVDGEADPLQSTLAPIPAVANQTWQSEVQSVELVVPAATPGASGLRGVFAVVRQIEHLGDVAAFEPCGPDGVPVEPGASIRSEATTSSATFGFGVAIASLDEAGNCSPVDRFSFGHDNAPNETIVQFRPVSERRAWANSPASGEIVYDASEPIEIRFSAAVDASGQVGAPPTFLVSERELDDCDRASADRVYEPNEAKTFVGPWDPAEQRRFWVRALDASGNCGPSRYVQFRPSR